MYMDKQDAARKNAAHLIRFLMWARDEAVESLDDQIAAASFDAIIMHLSNRFALSKEEFMEPSQDFRRH